MFFLARLLPICLLASTAVAQFIPVSDPRARNLTVVRSPANPRVTVAYKSPDGVCNTAFKTQKQYTGWVNVPGDYPTNLFFWFVEARERTQSLTIWLNGGPGSSSLYGFFTGNGPCEVVEKGLNDYDTVAREWGWDRASNILFIDQPNQVGLSYDTPTEGTWNFLKNNITEPPVQNPGILPDWTMGNGTFSSGNSDNTANTTEIAAIAVWHMVQGFLTTFPQYQPYRNSSLGINLFAESYGGRYGPVFAETFEEQNAKRLNGQLPRNSTVELHLSSLGIVNGCIDMQTQVEYYPIFANNNTYGFKALKDDEASFYLSKYSAKGGCKDLLNQCFTASEVSDPDDNGHVIDVNTVCRNAETACNQIMSIYINSGRSVYDLAAPTANPYPPLAFQEYLNQARIQKAIGAPVNYTMSSSDVFSEFSQTGDQARDGNIPRLAALLQKGVRIGFIYGDRDYICNWLGGEAVSLKLASATSPEYGANFSSAGYAPIIVNDTYIGGVVRQFGNLSFSRIYQAGHAVSFYQPETAFQVFARIIMGTSVSTGEDINLEVFDTTGPANATHTDDLPKKMKPTCYIRGFQDTCDDDAQKLVTDGRGVVINGILYSTSKDFPDLSHTPTSTPSPSPENTLTGVYTATTTPDAGASLQIPNLPLLTLITYIALGVVM